jgi:hypothetical protein
MDTEKSDPAPPAKERLGSNKFRLCTELPNAELVAADRVYVPAGT